MIVPGAGFMIWPVVFSGDCDPYWDNVVLAMHMDGANGSTAFTDEKGNTVTRNGGVVISTAQSPFSGGSSAYFDGAGDYLAVPYSSAFDIGTQDFVLSFWIRRDISASSRAFFGTRSSLGETLANRFYLMVGGDDKLRAYVHNSSSVPTVVTSSTDMLEGQYYYCEFTRVGGTYYLSQNGIIVATSTPTLITHTNAGLTIGIAHHETFDDFKGFLSDVLFKVGVGGNTADFTPPTAPFAEVAC